MTSLLTQLLQSCAKPSIYARWLIWNILFLWDLDHWLQLRDFSSRATGSEPVVALVGLMKLESMYELETWGNDRFLASGNGIEGWYESISNYQITHKSIHYGLLGTSSVDLLPPIKHYVSISLDFSYLWIWKKDHGVYPRITPGISLT